MFAELTGDVCGIESDHIILKIGGVGYKINVSTCAFEKFSALGGHVKLSVVTKFKTDKIVLFGFWNKFQKSAFEILTEVSGLSDRIAQSIVQLLSPAQIWEIIINDGKNPPKISGVGTKTWQKIAFELKSNENFKLLCLDCDFAQDALATMALDIQRDAVLALESMGIAKGLAMDLVQRAQKKHDTREDVGEIIKAALEMWKTNVKS